MCVSDCVSTKISQLRDSCEILHYSRVSREILHYSQETCEILHLLYKSTPVVDSYN